MQALRTKVLAQGSLRAIRGGGNRASKGLGWYKRYQEIGPDAFRKARAPTPFNWENREEPAPNSSRRQRRRVFIELAVDGAPVGRVEFELASDFLPVTCENFVRLCDGVLAPAVPRGLLRYAGDSDDFEDRREEEEEDRKTKEERILCFEGTRIHRIVRGTGLMGGDVENTDGRGGHSAFGSRFFPDEAFIIPHTAPGLLTMANSGVHSNGSQFFITTEPADHLDGRSVAFGRVTAGMDVVTAVSNLYNIRGRPVSEITVAKCGEL